MCQKKNKTSYLLLLTLLVYSSLGYAQQESQSDFAQESLEDATLVAWAGAGGAILGLSTLSFVDKPDDHFKNIYVGAALGVVAGVALVAYLQANKAQEQYNGAGISPLIDFKQVNEFSSEAEVSYGARWNFRF